jgi:DNA-binding winged helix-turn-helix (wHTH) protein
LIRHDLILLFDTQADRLGRINDSDRIFPVRPVSGRVLRFMIRSPDTLLFRRDIMEACWCKWGFVVEDNSLSQANNGLRQPLALLDPTSIYIKTVQRIGYCFLAKVRAARND